jgi:hypothetical protein
MFLVNDINRGRLGRCGICDRRSDHLNLQITGNEQQPLPSWEPLDFPVLAENVEFHANLQD